MNVNRYSVLRWIAYGLELFILYVLQETPGLTLPVFGARPFLLLPAALSIALFETHVPSMFLGILAGVLADYGMGHAPGFHAILLAILCFFLSEMAIDLIRTNFLTGLVTGLIGTAGVLFLQWLFFYCLPGTEYSGYILSNHYIPRILSSSLPIPLFYYLNRMLGLFIQERE